MKEFESRLTRKCQTGQETSKKEGQKGDEKLEELKNKKRRIGPHKGEVEKKKRERQMKLQIEEKIGLLKTEKDTEKNSIKER